MKRSSSRSRERHGGRCARHFSSEGLVKNRIESIACIPRCPTRLESTRFSRTSARDPRKMCRENGTEGRSAFPLEWLIFSFFLSFFFLYLRPSYLDRVKSLPYPPPPPAESSRPGKMGFSPEISTLYSECSLESASLKLGFILAFIFKRYRRKL